VDLKRSNWPVIAIATAFALVLSVTGFFAVRTVRRAVYWRVHRDEPIRPWMSVPYVAHSYRVPPHVLYEALGIPFPLRDRRPIRQIAREQNRPVTEVISVLETAIARARSHEPGAPPPPRPDNRERAP